MGWHLNRVYRAKVREAFPVCKQSGDAELTISRQFDETAPSFAPQITGPASRPGQDDAPPKQRQEMQSSRYYSTGTPRCSLRFQFISEKIRFLRTATKTKRRPGTS